MLTIVYGSETQSSYTDSTGTNVPGQIVQFGRLSAGPEVGYAIRDQDGNWVLESYLRLLANLDYSTSEQVFLNGLLVATRGTGSGSVAGGISWLTRGSFSARAEGSYESIGVAGLSAMLHFAWTF